MPYGMRERSPLPTPTEHLHAELAYVVIHDYNVGITYVKARGAATFQKLGCPSSLPRFPFPEIHPLKPARGSGECTAPLLNSFSAFLR